MSLLIHLKNFLQSLPSSSHLCVAYSGGMDSHVLLHLLQSLQIQYDFTLRAVHINHQLNPKAHDWQQHVINTCLELNVPLDLHAVNLNIKKGDSLEAKAREARYAYFAHILQDNEILCTAHHQEDQAETVLLQLLRGAGPKGLAAMPAIALFATGQHARPLLTIPHDIIIQYAKENQLVWITDDSNDNKQFDRNFLRHDIIPQLKKRFPAAASTISRSALHCASAQNVLDNYLQHDLIQLKGDFENTLSRSKLSQFEKEKQYHLLRSWFIARNFPLPSTVQLKEIAQLLTIKNDSNAKVEWQQHVACFYQNSLFAEPAEFFESPKNELNWNGKEKLVLPQHLGTLMLLTSSKGQLSPSILQQKITVRFYHNSEKCKVVGCSHTRPIKKILQSLKIPPWQRHQLPYIYVNNILAAVGDKLVMANYASHLEEVGLQIILT